MHRRDTPELGYSIKQLDSTLNIIGIGINLNKIGENVFGCLEFFDFFKVVENRREVMELGGFGQGFDEEVIGLRSWYTVVDAEGLDERGEKTGLVRGSLLALCQGLWWW